MLVAGGANSSGTLATAELYDYTTGLWTATGSMPNVHHGHTATLLPSGKVLIVSGYNVIPGCCYLGMINAADIYDPALGTWSTTGPVADGRVGHIAALLPSGKVMVAGGGNLSVNLASAEIWDPAAGTWSFTSSMASPRNDATGTLLPTGKLMVAGGFNESVCCAVAASAELYDPISETWSFTGSLGEERVNSTATLMAGGKVLVAGGYAPLGVVSPNAELYDSVLGTWSPTASMSTGRNEATATLLSDGRVLLAGGDLGSGSGLASAEIFSLLSVPVPATLTLEPATDTNPVNTQHCVTATVSDAFGNPTPGIVVRFSVSGANSASGSATTNASGQATFCYMGPPLPGADAITAFADTDNDNFQDPGEPSGAATKTWVLPVTTPLCEIKITNGGWIIAANGDRASFGGNAKSDGAGNTEGNENYQDHGPVQPMHVKSINVLAITCEGTTQASIFGQATIDGMGSFNYRIRVQDLGESGSSDTYWMFLSNGYNSGEQTLRGGNVQIKRQ